jgi:hypothetical protein
MRWNWDNLKNLINKIMNTEKSINEVKGNAVLLLVGGSYLPKCHYCGQFVNPNKGGVKMGVQYGFMCIEYDYYYHEKCAKGTERL